MPKIEKAQIDEAAFKRRVAGELPVKTDTVAMEPVMATEPAEPAKPQVKESRPKASGIGNNAEDRYRTKYLKPITNAPESKRFDVRLSSDLHLRLKRICNLVFDGQVSMAALITNVMNEHIDNHMELYDTIYQQPKSWNA